MKIKRLLNKSTVKPKKEDKVFDRYTKIRNDIKDLSVEESRNILENTKMSKTDKTAYLHDILKKEADIKNKEQKDGE